MSVHIPVVLSYFMAVWDLQKFTARFKALYNLVENEAAQNVNRGGIMVVLGEKWKENDLLSLR